MKKLLVLLCIGAFSACSNIGDPIPSFDLTSTDGEQITSQDLEGKATVMVIWATWCGDCVREIPELNQLASKYKDNDNVEFLAFSDEDEATVNRFLKRLPFNFKHLVDSKDYTDQLSNNIAKHFPQVLVLNKDLEVVFDVTENRKPIFNDLDKQIQEILSKQ